MHIGWKKCFVELGMPIYISGFGAFANWCEIELKDRANDRA